jgi:hypothetical protein
MQTCVLFLLFVAFVSMPAYAHRRHHHSHHHHSHEHFTANYVREKSNAPPESESRESEQESRVPVGPAEQQRSADVNTAGDLLLPQDWQRQPADPNWQGERYLSPDGTGSFSAYITPVAQEPIAQHMKTIAFADGERITRLRAERSWIEVSGFKGDSIFYRKSVLACGGTSWHEIAFEYPAEAQGMNVFVDRAAKGVEINQNKGCAAPVATSNGSASVSEQSPPAKDSATR